LAAALAAGTGCEESPGPGFILSEEEDDVELCEGEVEVPDAALRALLEEILPQPDPPEGAEEPPPPVILAEELRKLTGLRATDMGIADLTGLECALRLETLGLDGNAIKDLAPLGHINGIRQIGLSDNMITDLTVLHHFERLEKVTLDGNGIKDISPLAEIESLQFVDLARNEITDISALAGLTAMRGLVLSQNQVRDVGPLADLTELVALKLDQNVIDNVDAFEKLTKLRYVDLDANEVPSVASLAGAKDLIELEISTNQLTSLEGLSGKPRLLEINANENKIGTTDGVAGLTGLTTLELGSNQLTSLPGVETLVSLRKLQLAENQLTDIAAVAGLPAMRHIDIRNNPGIVDISPVATLPLLGTFVGGIGQTLDLSPLGGRSVLKIIQYTEAAIVGDLAFLADVVAVEQLDLRSTLLTQPMVQQMALLPNLQSVKIDGCGVSDLSPLGQSAQMEALAASDNLVTEVSFLQFWPNATEVVLARNPIQSLEGVEMLEHLRVLDVSGTQIQDLAPLAANETFRQGDEVVAEGTPLDPGDCGDIATIRGRNGTVTVDFDCP
jgi:Leucine-rich repeat (LRR) protein